MPIIQSAPAGPASASLKLGDLELLADPFDVELGTTFGGWTSITSAISSLFLDGTVVTGDSTGNREITLQVTVRGSTHASRVAASEDLIAQANQHTNTLTFTPAGGIPIVYDVFRVNEPKRVDDETDNWNFWKYELTFPALPFARSATRETPSLSAPTTVVSLDDFEAPLPAAGVFATEAALGGSSSIWSAPVVDGATAATAADIGMTAVTNCTVATGTTSSQGISETVEQITATAAGLVEVESTATWAVGSGVATVALLVGDHAGSTTPHTYIAGIEWLDSGGVSLRTDWGTPWIAAPTDADLSTSSGYQHNGSPWTASPPPANAASVRYRLRVTDATAGEVFDCSQAIIVFSAGVSGNPASRAQDSTHVHDGTYAGLFAMQKGQGAPGGDGYLYVPLASAVNLTTVDELRLWVYAATVPQDFYYCDPSRALSVRLFDGAGNWSRFVFNDSTRDTVPADTWTQLRHALNAPYSSSTTAADLSNVVAFDVEMRGRVASGAYATDVWLDSLVGQTADAPGVSPRGNVFDVDVKGSARSPAQITLANSTAMTDFLVAAVKTDAPPLVVVSNGSGSVAAPAGYKGQYCVLGSGSSPTSLGTSCTVAQLINGTQVATKTLTGAAVSGNHYMDYGTVSLPLVAVPDENTSVSYTFTFAAGSAGDLLLIDADASLAWASSLSSSMKIAWVDEPDAAGIGRLWLGSVADRSDARAMLAPGPALSRPLLVVSPSSRLLVYSSVGTPDLSLSYFPRYLVEPS